MNMNACLLNITVHAGRQSLYQGDLDSPFSCSNATPSQRGPKVVITQCYHQAACCSATNLTALMCVIVLSKGALAYGDGQ